jgi:hypothetical protein
MILSTFNPAISPAAFVAFLCESLKYAGTVITASVIVVHRYFSASSLIFWRMKAEICSGLYSFPSIKINIHPSLPSFKS